MSAHSYSRCWLHLTWATLNRARLLQKPAAARLSAFLYEYAQSKNIYMRINYVNAERVDALIDLPTRYSIEEVVKLLKGASSHWVNQNRLVQRSSQGPEGTARSRFRNRTWTGYQSTLRIRRGIIGERRLLKNTRGLFGPMAWNGEMTKREETVKTVPGPTTPPCCTLLKKGVNEMGAPSGNGHGF